MVCLNSNLIPLSICTAPFLGTDYLLSTVSGARDTAGAGWGTLWLCRHSRRATVNPKVTNKPGGCKCCRNKSQRQKEWWGDGRCYGGAKGPGHPEGPGLRAWDGSGKWLLAEERSAQRLRGRAHGEQGVCVARTERHKVSGWDVVRATPSASRTHELS